MKNRMKWIFGITWFTLAMSFSIPDTANAQPGGAVSYQTFYDDLSPYGDWIYDPDYGYVWAPQAGNDFRPYYTNGRWAMTEYGNTWISAYDWGWAPFHYGRWTYNRFYGWVWIPGTTWGPAWVSWRTGGGNYGWAPMGPGISINISFGNSYYVPYDWWTFVPYGNIYSGYYNNYWRGAGYNNTYMHNTVIINNTYNNTYVYGPRKNEVEQVTGGRVNVYNIRDGRTAGKSAISGNSVNIYRPAVRTAAGNRKEAPRNFQKADNSRSIRSAAPALTGKTALERNQLELKAHPVRSIPASGRNADRNTIRKNSNLEKINSSNKETERTGNIREQRAVPNERTQETIQQRQVREQQVQAERQQRVQQEQQLRLQQSQAREQQVQAEREQRARQEQQQRMQREQQQQQRQIREQQIQQRPAQQAPQREWRRPEPQRIERPQPAQRQSPPAQRGGGFERSGRR